MKTDANATTDGAAKPRPIDASMLAICHDALYFANKKAAFVELNIAEQHRITGVLLEIKDILGLTEVPIKTQSGPPP